MMNERRNLLRAALAAVAVGSIPRSVRAQARPRRIGFLWSGQQADPVLAERVVVFKTALRDLGYLEGRDYVLEQRFGGNDRSRLPALAAELVALKVDAIVGGSSPSIVAARDKTREIPILMTVADNVVAAGIVTSLSRPGGNITGLTSLTSELYPKRLDLLREIVAGIRRVGILSDPQSGGAVRALEAVGRKLQLEVIPASLGAGDVEAAFKTFQSTRAQGLIVVQGSTSIAFKQSIVQHAAASRLPAVYPLSVFAEAGGLVSYSADVSDIYRRLAAYIDKIFKGTKPGDLPIEQPTKFELIINRKTARALGITIPESILVQATQVIE